MSLESFEFLNALTMFSKCYASTRSKWWLSEMHFVHKLVFSEENFVNSFIRFKLIISSIKTDQLFLALKHNVNKTVLNEVLIRNFAQ